MRQLIARGKGKRASAGRAASLATAVVAVAALLGHLAAGHPASARTPAVGQFVVTITDGGMTPAQATAQAGIVHLRLENRTAGEVPLTVRVARSGGAQVRDITVAARGEVATELELGAASYTLSVVSNPSWTCQLTVQ